MIYGFNLTYDSGYDKHKTFIKKDLKMDNKVQYTETRFINGQKVVELEYLHDEDKKLRAINIVWETENGDRVDEPEIAKGTDRYNAVIEYFQKHNEIDKAERTLKAAQAVVKAAQEPVASVDVSAEQA
jgi:hypothetical protein